MTDGFKKLQKSFSATADDLLIRAMIARADGSGYQMTGFKRDRIDYLTELDAEAGISGIALKTGAKIPVKMSYADLERKVYFTDLSETPVLDLSAVTGAAVPAAMPSLSEDFETHKTPVIEKQPLEDVPLKIALFARQSGEQNFRMFIFDEEDVDWETVEGINGKNGKSTKFTLDYGTGPFGEDEVIFDMPRPKFMELYNLAKMSGQSELDLREWTRRRDPDNSQPPEPLKEPIIKGRTGPGPGY